MDDDGDDEERLPAQRFDWYQLLVLPITWARAQADLHHGILDHLEDTLLQHQAWRRNRHDLTTSVHDTITRL